LAYGQSYPLPGAAETGVLQLSQQLRLNRRTPVSSRQNDETGRAPISSAYIQLSVV
jgi:hypothetical protein